ncbi:MAG TPA: hypothetical protein VIK55_18880 [Paludibacter sp.]
MSFKCKIGLHSWNGCKCSDCDKIRDEQHDWSHDCEECSRCGKTKESRPSFKNDHGQWQKSVITHDWSNDCEKCSKCGKSRDNQHNWSEDCEKCSKCAKTRENQHDWKGCKCSKCGKTRDEQHDWSKNCEKCSNCSKLRSNAHVWMDSVCTNCGIKKVEIKYFEQERPSGYALCSWDPCPCEGSGTILHNGEGYLYIPEKSVEFRRDCLTYFQFQTKLQIFSQLSPFKSFVFTDVPVLVCDKGIGRLNIDPIVAREDAKYWWSTGLIPLRASPKRS